MSPSRIKNNQADPQNMLHISRPHPTPTATLIETTRGLAFRSQAINYAMQNAGGERQERGERGERGGRGGRGGRGRGGGGAGREQPNGDAQE
jgi:translation initiation factor 3 subunit E